jgi:hypothetical protein
MRVTDLEEERSAQIGRDVLADASNRNVLFVFDDRERRTALDENAEGLRGVSVSLGESGVASVEEDCTRERKSLDQYLR